MDARQEIREFLTSRRARLNAADVGLPDYGARRVPGLRREEVAVLAGVSVPYYARLERGDLAGASDSVLHALARALRLDDAERAHLIDLARAVQPLAPPQRRRGAKDGVRRSVQNVLEAITGAAALVLNDRHDVLAANALSRALFVELFDGQERPNLFKDAVEGYREFSAGGATGYWFDNVQGLSTSTVVALAIDGFVYEFGDPDQRHQSDGFFLQTVRSFKPTEG